MILQVNKNWLSIYLVIMSSGLALGLYLLFTSQSGFLSPTNPGSIILASTWSISLGLLDFKSSISSLEDQGKKLDEFAGRLRLITMSSMMKSIAAVSILVAGLYALKARDFEDQIDTLQLLLSNTETPTILWDKEIKVAAANSAASRLWLVPLVSIEGKSSHQLLDSLQDYISNYSDVATETTARNADAETGGLDGAAKSTMKIDENHPHYPLTEWRVSSKQFLLGSDLYTLSQISRLK